MSENLDICPVCNNPIRGGSTSTVLGIGKMHDRCDEIRP